ncbi:MAG: D-galactose transport system ATP-binding protein [Solirubrobacterales bacterium]|nr:D-galactose transport system ATP-binding protein [Solirubrobacterales bacterium]
MSLLEIESLRVEFPGEEDEQLVAVKGVDLAVEQGETVGLVGESGSGKSLTCRAVMRMIPEPGVISAGQVRFDGEDVLSLGTSKLRDFRAHSVGMIYQNPFGSLNPTMRVGSQIAETLKVNKGMKRDAAKKEAVALLDRVGIEDPERRFRSYPHELSGGMCQRVMIAISTASSPRLMLADEPTTALDVTTQAQILKLLAKMRAEEGMAMLLVSHDFGVIAQACDRVAVMYGGHIVETGPVETIYHEPEHPYTRALLNSVPELDSAGNVQRRAALEGHPPELAEVIPGCVFAPRCEHAKQDCAEVAMKLEPVGPDHASACPVRPYANAGARSVDKSQRVEA